jgi:hypothetical protein
MNINRIIKDIRGNEGKISFPQSPEEKDKPETVGNVLLNCLAAFPVTERKQVFYVNTIASQILNAGDEGVIELNTVHKDFLKEAVFKALFRTEIEDGVEVEKGVYLPSVVAQVFEELGVTEE